MAENFKFRIQEIDERWNDQMIDIVRRSPIEANGLKIILDRHPDIFLLPKLLSGKLRCAGVFYNDQLVGFAMMLYKELYVNGKLKTLLYFGNLVVEPFAKGKGFLFRMTDFFLHDLPPDKILGYGVIMKKNNAALRLINRFHPRYHNVPYIRNIGEWEVKNILMIFPVFHKSPYSVRTANADDIDSIVLLLQNEYRNRLFGPVVTKEQIENKFRILPDFDISNYYIAEIESEAVGVCCAWDMSQVKKNRVVSYSRKLKRVRSLIKIFGWIFNFPALPVYGGPFRDVTITDYAVKNRNPKILKALLAKIYAEYREKKYNMMHLGHPVGDPIGISTSPFITLSLISEILIFSKSKQPADQFENSDLPLIDMSLL